MDAMSRLVRVGGGTVFYPVFVSHVTNIVALDKSEDDAVKWYGMDTAGNEMYVSMNLGHSYTLHKTV